MWVLTYHSISNGPPPLCTAPDRFAGQLDRLLQGGWRPVTLATALAGSLEPPWTDKRFAVTFDDAYRDFLDEALPILQRRAIPTTLFATTATDRSHLPGGLTGLPLLEPAVLRELARQGISFGAHGVRHRDLTQLPSTEQEAELRDGRDQLMEWLGCEVDHLAYPFGRFDEALIKTTTEVYSAAFTTQLAEVPRDPHPHAIPRIDAYYLDAAGLLDLAGRAAVTRRLAVRRWLRRARGTEPRRAIPASPAGRATTEGGPSCR